MEKNIFKKMNVTNSIFYSTTAIIIVYDEDDDDANINRKKIRVIINDI